MICDSFYSLQNNLLWTLLCADSAACTFLLINISYIVYYMDSISRTILLAQMTTDTAH